GQTAADQQLQQTAGQDAVEGGQLRPVGAAAQQLQGFHRAVVGQKVIVAVITPVQLGAALDQHLDLTAFQPERNRGQAAQLDLGVFVDHLAQRQDEQARRVG